jgi:predicted MFS family arabinose efflux permease
VALVLGPAVYALAYLGFGASGDFAWIAACVALLTFGEVVFSPALSDMAIYLGDPRRFGRSFGLFGLVQTLGVALGPLLGGAVFDSLRDRHLTMWATFGGMMAVVAVAYAAFARRYDVRVQ